MSRFGRFETPSLWAATGVPATPVRGTLVADVAVVGSGVVGMSIALHLAEQGCRVVVLDGSTGDAATRASLSSGGLIAPQLVRGNAVTVRDRFGEAGERFVAGVAAAGGATWDLIARHGLDCDAAPTGFLAPFRAPQRAQIEDTLRTWAGLRDDLSLLDAAETRRLTGCTGYDGALLDRSGGALNPNAYAWEMGRRAAELGAQVLRGARVLGCETVPDGVQLHLADATVQAGRVILAANGGNMALHPALARTVLPLAVREVATMPLPVDLRARVMREGHAMTDRGPDIFTLRYDAAGRLITAATMPWGQGKAALERAVNARMARMIPGWRATPLSHAWTGTAWLNADLQPRFVLPESNMLAVQACNGRGVALAALIGRDAARWALTDATDLCLPITSPRPIAAYAVARRLPNFAMGLAAVKSRIAA